MEASQHIFSSFCILIFCYFYLHLISTKPTNGNINQAMWAPLLALQFIVSACRGRGAALQVSVTSPGLKVVIAWESPGFLSQRGAAEGKTTGQLQHTRGKKKHFFCFSAMAMFIACGWTFLPAFYQVWTFIIIFGFSASSYFKAGSRVCGFSVLEIHGKPLKLFTYLDEDVLSEETKKTAL